MAEEKTETEIMRWFESELLPQLVAEGRMPVPEDWKICALEHSETNLGTDHFASKPYFTEITLKLPNDSEELQTINVITKFITQNIASREAMETDVQFCNEMVFYNQIVPAFKAFLKGRPRVPANFLEDIFPVCRYAHMDLTNPDYGVVVMDDLRVKGFKCAASTAELELQFCLVALRKLAKFHALSYAMKVEAYKDFPKLAGSFKECLYRENRHMTEKDKDILFSESCLRGIDYLLSHQDSEPPASYLLMLRKKVLAGACKMMRDFMKPSEPLAVICHGDFCRNNILFSFKNDTPVNCRLFDFQTWRYGNPSIDLTFFVYMNTTLELREQYFDDLLKVYWETLVDTVCLITLKSDSEIKAVYPYKLFYNDFCEHSLYGYTIIANFLPVMMVPNQDPGGFEDDFRQKTVREMARENVEHGGEIVTKRISEVIVDMYRRGCYL